ncbi:CaiB/BaiF CoA transferase family protein [Microbaculum marinum]|uniref:CoA transferase n=1 Tax=Microbaculum marinum TaxID=1764581 RepID=A0AAW9RGV4_9HYPH
MSTTGPLAGVRVVELSHIMAGPTCGMMLADMGADVIKVERPGGDDTRRFAPPDVNGVSAAFMMMNRNKRGVAFDLKQPDAAEALRRIARSCDVLIENYRLGTMEKLGIGYETLKAENPGLIYCSLSGFGRTGPYSTRGGFDLIAQGMSGIMSITGEGPGRPPVKVGAPVTDITAGIIGAMGVLAAYVHRLKTGEGQIVDSSLLEAGITQTYWQSAIAFATGISPGPMGSAHPLSAPYQAFETADGWINIGAANQANWQRLLRILDAAELGEDPRFSENSARMANLPELEKVLTPYFRKRSSAEWLAMFEEAGLPGGPVLTVGQMHADPHVQARQMVVDLEHPQAGPTKALGLPVKFSDTPGSIRRPAPLHGEHTREILAEVGYSDAEIERMVGDGAAIVPETSDLEPGKT